MVNAFIAPDGYARIDALRGGTIQSPIGFCAMWFENALLPVWTDAMAPAIEGAGYRPVRLDQEEHNNKIDDEIIATIRRSRFIVADFTGHRGGVYFEAGFGMGLSIPVFWTVLETDLENVHFDNRQYNFIPWHLDNLADLKTRLQNRIEATLGRGPLYRAVGAAARFAGESQ